MENRNNTPIDNIIFFDGVCALCNRFVLLLLRVDRKKRLKFCSLQSKLANEILECAIIENIDSIVFLKKGKVYLYSSAILQIIQELGGLWHFLLIFAILPLPLRDVIYKFIARNRYQWFGTLKHCAILNEADKNRILE